MARDIIVLRGTIDTVVFAAPTAAARLRGLYGDNPRLRRRLRPSLAKVRRILQDDTNRVRLLRAWSDLRLPGDPPAGSAEFIATRLEKCIESERIVALSLPPATLVSGTTIDREAIAARARAFDSPHRNVATGSPDPSTWTNTHKVREMLSRVPGHLAHNLAESLKSLLTLENAEIMAGSLVVLAGLHAIGIGEAVDAGLAFYAWRTAGPAGLTALADMLIGVSRALKARTNKDIDDAAVKFAAAFAVLGVSILTLIMTRAGRRSVAGEEVGGATAGETNAQPLVRKNIARTTARENERQASALRDFNTPAPRAEADAFAYYMQKARTLDVSTAENGAVFYSGTGNRTLAEDFARANGRTTLEMTPGGSWLDDQKLFNPGSPLTPAQATDVWSTLSERFAGGASGNAIGFVKGAREGSIFNSVEYPALRNNPSVINVITGGN